MTPYAFGDSPRPSHHEILEEEHDSSDHVADVLCTCRYIINLVRAGIDK